MLDPSPHRVTAKSVTLIADSIEQVMREHTGRDSVQAGAVSIGDVVTVRMREPLTTRQLLHEPLSDVIESVTGQRVVQVFTGYDTEAQTTLDVFVLAPQHAGPQEDDELPVFTPAEHEVAGHRLDGMLRLGGSVVVGALGIDPPEAGAGLRSWPVTAAAAETLRRGDVVLYPAVGPAVALVLVLGNTLQTTRDRFDRFVDAVGQRTRAGTFSVGYAEPREAETGLPVIERAERQLEKAQNQASAMSSVVRSRLASRSRWGPTAGSS